MFIAIEGVDGVGKSTLCDILAKRLNAVSYMTPPKKYLALRTQVDKNASADEHYRFYKDGVLDASEEISALLQKGDKIICDRYWLTTYTYHQVMGVSVAKDDFQSVIIPDLTVILSLNHEVQIKRILQRGMSVGDRRVLDKQRDIAVAFYKNVLDFNIPFLVIDTQHFSPEESADIVIKSLEH